MFSLALQATDQSTNITYIFAKDMYVTQTAIYLYVMYIVVYIYSVRKYAHQYM